MHIEPRFSFIPAETFPNIWEHRPLVLAGECVVSAYSQIHNAHMNRLHLMVVGGEEAREGSYKDPDSITIQIKHME